MAARTKGTSASKSAGKKKATPKRTASKSAGKKRSGSKKSTSSSPRGKKQGRYAFTHDVDGPHMRLGVIWFVALVAALALGPVALGVLCGLVAGVGGMQVAKSWHRRRQPVSVVAAGVGAAALPIAAAWGGRALGLALLAAVFGSVVVAAAASSEKPVLAAAGWTVRSWLFVGGPAASLVLLTDYDLGAAVSLVVLMSAYDAGDYVVGSGARTSWEGPVGGLAATVVLTLSLYVINVSPFHGGPVIVYGVVFAVLAPLGQLAASAVLPAPDEIASGLRRFDSILLGGPVWAGLMAAGFAL